MASFTGTDLTYYFGYLIDTNSLKIVWDKEYNVLSEPIISHGLDDEQIKEYYTASSKELSYTDWSKKHIYQIGLVINASNTALVPVIMDAIDIEYFNNILLSSNNLGNSKRELQQAPENVIIDDMLWTLLLDTIKLNEYPLLLGPKGAGKTTICMELAKTLDMDFFPMNCATIHRPDAILVGTLSARNGDTIFNESEFLKYFKSDKPTLIFLNELTRLPKDASNQFINILDPIQSYIYNKELGIRVEKGKQVYFIADGNYGDEYTDVRQQDGALLDRFVRFKIKYLKEDDEVKLIHYKTGYKGTEVRLLVKFANQIRADYNNYNTTISPRQLEKFSRYIKLGYSLDDLIDNIIPNLFLAQDSEVTSDTIRKIFSVL